MRKIFLFLGAVAISTTLLTAQNQTTFQNQTVGSNMPTQQSINFKFTVATKTQINNDLTHIISIDNVKTLPDGSGFEVWAYANPAQFQTFLSRNIPYQIITKKAAKALTMATTVAAMAYWDAYPTYSVYEQLMTNFAANYPALCDIDTILSSTPSGNYRILVAKLSHNVNTAENEPQFFYTSSIHGDETTGYILMLRLINYLLSNYGTLPKVTNLMNNAEIWICPLSNPEGTYYNSTPVGSTIVNSIRENLAGVDLNRNYPDPLAGQHPDGGSWAPETQAFMTFATKHHFNMSANFHGGAELLNFPWDTWTTPLNPNADDAWWRRVCTAYVDSARLVTPTYFSDTYASGITEGGDWYVITGGRQDYMNYFQHCREQTIELDAEKTTQTQNLNLKWNQNYHSLLNYIQESTYGVRGIITDSCSGLGIKAKIWVNAYDQTNDSSQVYSALPVGNYHKYMIAGTYSITYSAPGYNSKTITGVALANGAATIRNIQLSPTAAPDAQFTGVITDNCAGTVQFTNTSASSTSFLWKFGDGSTSTQTNPIHTYPVSGTYTVKLYATNCKGSDSLVRTNYLVITMTTAPTVTGDARCDAGAVNLSASGAGTLNWYDAPSGGNLVNTGTSYSIPSLSTTTTYYVANSTATPNQYVGKPDSVGGGAMYNTTTYYLLFDCSTAVILKSVVVYASTTASRTITLNSSTGAVLSTTTVSIPAGMSTVALNFNVPVGIGMSLRCTSTNPNMYRSSGGITFPYSIAGKISITGTNASASRYYFFYNWEIETPGGCASARVPVVATIGTTPTAGFSNIVSLNTVNFTNTSTNATSYQWTFGDGGSSSSPNPSHLYTTTGNYTVQLIVINGNCSDTSTQQVVITTVGVDENLFSKVAIYPNPVLGDFTIDFGTRSTIPVIVDIYSMNGQLRYTKTISNTLEPANINIASFAAGVYAIRLSTATDQKYFRIFKSN
ncbi:MAG: M14 family zinc carboxypeptidase [Bacteroidota bacterium]